MEHRVSLELSEAMRSFARRQRVTVNTIVQGAWGLLLSRYAGEEVVLFGATVSGRPADLAGMDEMVGLFNTLPVRVQVRGEARVGEWLGGLWAQQVEAREYEHSPLAEVRCWSDVPAGLPLFETIVFENHPVRAEVGEGEDGFRVENWTVFGESHYALALNVLPWERLELNLEHDRLRGSGRAGGRRGSGCRSGVEAE